MKPDLFSNAQRLLDSLFKVEPGADENATQNRRRRRVVLIGGGAVALAAAVIFILTHMSGDGAKQPEVDRTQVVTAVRAEPGSFSAHVSLQGEIRPRRDYQIYAPAQGVRILQLLADEGDTVRAGQPLARLDTALSTAQASQAQANVVSAQAAQRRARDEYARAESIRESGALSTEAIEQRRAAAAAADAQLAAARASLAEVNARLQGGYVRAPAAGLVIARTAEIGRPVDNQLLFRIAGDNALEVAADIAEADILALREGQGATFQLVDGTTITGRLTRLPASIDSRTRTGQALFALPNGTRARAGMFVRGEAVLAAREALSAPQNAILYRDGAAYVFVVGDDHRVHATPVRLGARDGDRVEIVEGLASGARLVGAGGAFLQDGDAVRAIAAPETAAATPTAAPDSATTPDRAADDGAPDLRGRGG